MHSSLPGDDLDGFPCKSGEHRIGLFLIEDHVLESRQALLELGLSGRVLCDGIDQLHRVEFRLLGWIFQQHDDLIQLVQIVDLHLSLLHLSQRGQGTSGGRTHRADFVSQHLTKRLDAASLDAVVLANSLVADGTQVDGRQLADVLVRGLQVRVEIFESIG